MTPSTVPGLPATTLPALLTLLPNGIVYYTPVLAAAGEVVDFQFAYLNPAAQRLLGLPAQPTASYLQQWPSAAANGAFTFLHDAYWAGTPALLDQFYQADGYDIVIRAHATRLEDGLLVSFTDDSNRPRTVVDEALRESQAREQAARTKAERQRTELARVFEQAPLAIAVYRGPNYVIELANPTMCRLWGRTAEQIVGKGLFEALPEVAGMGYEELLDGVMATGVPHVAPATKAQHDRNGRRETVYWGFVYVPMREADGRITGALVVANEVTEQVLARQQVQQLNEELELRVTARSADVRAALHEVEHQREQLRTQQALLGQILGQVPAAITTLAGPEHRFTFFNERYQNLAANRAILGRTAVEVMPEVAEQGFIAMLNQVYATGQPYVGTETVIMLHDQATNQAEQRYIDFICQALKNGQGQTQGILAFALDVTDRVRTRKQAETLQTAMRAVERRQVQEREELYQVFEQAPVVIAQLRGPEHLFQYRNPAFQALFPGHALIGRLYAEALPEVVAGLVHVLDQVYATGEPYYGTALPFVTTPPDSAAPHERYYDFSFQPYREQGRITGISIFAYEVTEQVQTRRQADTLQAGLLAAVKRQAQHRQDLYQVFEQTPAAIVLLREPDHRIDYLNPAFEVLFPPEEWTGGPLHGHTLAEVYPRLKMAGLIDLLDRVFDTGEPQVVIEMALAELQPGSPRYVTFAYQAYREDERIMGVAAFVYDATEQVLARQQVQTLNETLQATNQELADSNHRLTRTNADLDTFVYTASHDLKAPISNIEGLLLALREQLPPAALHANLVPRLLDMMEGSVTRFQQTIGHLTDISQLQQAEAPETVDLTVLIAGVRLDLAPLIEAAPATLTVTVDDCQAVRVAPKTLRSVVYNLLSNAVKYRAPDRSAQVQLRAHCTPGHLVLAVQDNGLGLSEAQQGELFGMFRRLHTHVEGSGVGLFTVKRLVDNAGGTITVQSQPGVGSTFTVSLPA